MFVEQASDDMRFYLAASGLFVSLLVAVVVITIGINIGSERDPLAVGRPNGSGCAGRDLRDLFLVIAVLVHHPDLAARGEGNLLSVRRPARSARRTLAARQTLQLVAAIDRRDVDLGHDPVCGEVNVTNGERHAASVR